jgi:thioredoxin reductase (NADPH)
VVGGRRRRPISAPVTSTHPEPLPETPDIDGAFPRLTDGQIAKLADRGERRPTRPGQVLYREGDESPDFYVVLEGKVAVVDGYGRDERIIGVHGPGRFLGELNLLIGQPSFVTAVVREPGAVLAVPVEELRRMVAHDEALGDLILRAYLQRRNLLIGLGTGLRIIGSRFSPDTRRLREFAARNRIPHRWIDLEEDPSAERLLQTLGVSPQDTPVVIWRGEQVLRNPSTEELARVIGLPAPGARGEHADLLVVGAGPAGLAAGVYGASEGLDTLLLDAVATGGQAGRSPRIENYLGFPSGISGGELADRATIQAEKFGAAISVPADVVALEQRDGLHALRLANGTTVAGRTIVIATGARYRKLGVPNLERYEGISVYYAATVVEARLCGGDPVAVVGGGNSAGQAALFLTDYAAQVRLFVRGADLGENMSRYLVDEIERHPKIEVWLHTEVRELVGDDVLRALVVQDSQTGERRTVEARVLFVFIGAKPHTAWLGGQVALDGDGFILTGPEAINATGNGHGARRDRRCLLLETSRPGVFAAGDVRRGSIKRVASAAGEGAMSVRMVHEHLADSHRAPEVAERAQARMAAQTYVSSK